MEQLAGLHRYSELRIDKNVSEWTLLAQAVGRKH
jgi:hypothetical protein